MGNFLRTAPERTKTPKEHVLALNKNAIRVSDIIAEHIDNIESAIATNTKNTNRTKPDISIVYEVDPWAHATPPVFDEIKLQLAIRGWTVVSTPKYTPEDSDNNLESNMRYCELKVKNPIA